MSVPEWLDEGARFAPEYRQGLSNHLPMALLALRRLGAPDSRIDDFAARYVRRLEPAPMADPWRSADLWQDRLGERDSWPSYRTLFADWMGREGTDSVLAQALPRLMTGCGAAAFHGIIRTAYGAHSGHDRELVDGLAYWACCHLPLGVEGDGNGVADPAQILHGLRISSSSEVLISEGMRVAAQSPDFDQLIMPLKVDNDTLGRLSRLAATLYASSGNFTVLHLVTSCHAVRVLLPFLDETQPALHSYWRAFAAGYIASGLVTTSEAKLRPWDPIVEAAIASNDEHVVKLVDSCREEEHAYGGDEWRHAASRAVASVK
ncbi:MAG: questin oxidase family protein [Ilumatobacteraceae bacterium]